MAKTPVKSNFDKRLKDAGQFWAAAKEKAASAKSSQFAEFEDGRYTARLIGGSIGESQNGRLQIVWKFKIEEGEYEGQEKHDFQGLETEQNLEFVARRVAQLGYDVPENLEDLKEILADVAKTRPICKIRLKTKGEFQNLYVDKVFWPDEAEAEETPDAPAAEEAEETEEEEDAEPDAVDLTAGMRVIAATSQGDVEGEVLVVLEDEGKVRVKLDTGKVIRIAAEKLSVSEEVPEEPAEKKKATKKR